MPVKFYTRIFSDQRRSTKNIVGAGTKPKKTLFNLAPASLPILKHAKRC